MFTRASATRIKTRVSGLPMVKQAAFGAVSKIYLKIYFFKKIDFYSTASAISVQRPNSREICSRCTEIALAVE